MNSVFIGGIPASGKTYLAKKLSKFSGLSVISIDKLKKEMSKDPKVNPWVNFYLNLDEKQYYENTSCKKQWQNLVSQSEAFWPSIVNTVRNSLKVNPYIIEGVNLLPHLARKDFRFKGVYLLGESKDKILLRIKQQPRWGKTEYLQKLEANAFFNCERKLYQKEANKNGYLSFGSSQDAYNKLKQLMSS